MRQHRRNYASADERWRTGADAADDAYSVVFFGAALSLPRRSENLAQKQRAPRKNTFPQALRNIYWFSACAVIY